MRIPPLRNPEKLQKGFTLPEFIFAIVITAVIVPPIVILLIQRTINTTETETASIATALAVQTLEGRMWNYTFNNVAGGAGTYPAPFQSYSYNVTANQCYTDINPDVAVACTPTSNYKLVTVTVSHAGIQPVSLSVLRGNY